MGYLISAAELAREPSVLIFDCRANLMDKSLGRASYEAGHIPGARFADMETDLASEPGAGGRHPLPDSDTLAAKLRQWGVSNDSRLVCYDQNTGAFAARFWWLLRWLGHAEVRLLDGGLDAWLEAGHSLETDEASPVPGEFSIRPSLTRTCDPGELLDGNHVLLDARETARYRGEVEPIDPVAGHIPGALSFPFADNLDANARFKSPAELAERFQSVLHQDKVVSYCGSGVTATHNILAMLIAGFPEPILYPGSWSGWITDPDRPVETG